VMKGSIVDGRCGRSINGQFVGSVPFDRHVPYVDNRPTGRAGSTEDFRARHPSEAIRGEAGRASCVFGRELERICGGRGRAEGKGEASRLI